MTSPMTNEEVLTFRKNFNYLINKAITHLMEDTWKEQMDRNVRIHIAIINEKEVHFELMLDMIGKLLETKSFTWEEINNLE